MKTIKTTIILCSILITCILAQAVDVDFVDDDISFFAGDTVNIYIELLSENDAEIYLNISIFPDGEYFNLTYPETINLTGGKTKTIILEIITPINMEGENFTINLTYILDSYIPEEGNGGGNTKTTSFYVMQDDSDDISYPIISPPKIRKDGIIKLPSPPKDDEMITMFSYAVGLAIILIAILMVVFLIMNRKKNNGEK